MLPNFIRSAADLVTSHSAVRAGFLSQALTKTDKATPFIEKAKRLWSALQDVQDINSLLTNSEFRSDLIAATGFSQKACNQLSKTELDSALRDVLGRLLTTAGTEFREEILYRYLLTMGDALGGQMRNFTGADAGIRFTQSLLDALQPHEAVRELRQNQKTGKIQRIR